MKKYTLAELIEIAGGNLDFVVNIYDESTDSYLEVVEVVHGDMRVDLNMRSL